jgi:Fe-S-cluster containining protein
MRALRFACQKGCTRCCDVRGFVYLSEADVTRAAAFLNLSPIEFEERYTIRYRHVIRLRKPLDSQCHFLTESGCSIHPVKPTQCRLYPFWPELVENVKGWKEAAKTCPGIGQGELVQIGLACEIAGEMRSAYPHMYPELRKPKL